MIETTSRCIACITSAAFRATGITEDDANNGKLMFFSPSGSSILMQYENLIYQLVILSDESDHDWLNPSILRVRNFNLGGEPSDEAKKEITAIWQKGLDAWIRGGADKDNDAYLPTPLRNRLSTLMKEEIAALKKQNRHHASA